MPVRSWPANGPMPAVGGTPGAAAATRIEARPARSGRAPRSAVGSPASTTPAGSSATTVQPRSVESTRPVTFTASPGSISGSRSAASPCRITGPTAVPSSSEEPVGQQVADDAADADRDRRRSSPGRRGRRRGRPARRRSVAGTRPDPCSRRARSAGMAGSAGPRRHRRSPCPSPSTRPRVGRCGRAAGSRSAGPSRSGTGGGRCRRPSRDGPCARTSTGIPAPAWPSTTTRSFPTRSSARQRSPSLFTLSIRPRTVTSRHSCASPGER